MKNKIIIVCLFLFSSCNDSKSVKNSSDAEVKPELKEASLPDKFREPLGYVSDFENLFTVQQISELEKRLSEFELINKRKISIVTVDSIEPYEDILDFATHLAKEWGTLDGDPNNGLLILFSRSIGQISIVTGIETRERITDEVCEKVINKIILPEFKNENYFIGIDKSVTYLIKYW
ncbi:uncharacterized protein SAMN06265375_1011057 [Muriicola jejuensis]|uniref:TPM domain-containing protein n=1 Tax=Muriicola jejuensis TaxID=504488 RepID=A0A6P0UCS5_9FLAO|nr:TPM domain-containing protein [Muriicola jejuensis]NER09438.1 TPM domain-containing protein [Muriicola jejuensis]SMP08673.1 uncharacterized protein SAMN06265375_1011057 [Muriicola jejuensis]